MSITNKGGTYNRHLDSLHQNTDKLHQTNPTMAMAKEMNCFYSKTQREETYSRTSTEIVWCTVLNRSREL